jgi:hypothetical protein
MCTEINQLGSKSVHKRRMENCWLLYYILSSDLVISFSFISGLVADLLIFYYFFSLLLASLKGTISLPSLCPSVCHCTFGFPDFCLQWIKIFNWYLIYDFISVSYRSSFSFVTLDILLTELFPLMFTFTFLDFFFLPWMKWGVWNFFCMASSWIVIDQVEFRYIWPIFDWIMSLDKLRYSIWSRIIKYGILMHLNKKKFVVINQGHCDL